MGPRLLGSLVLIAAPVCLDAELPLINTSPQSQTVTPGSTAIFNVGASGATSFQWRFNGADIAGATASSLSVTGAVSGNAGYYLVLAKNSSGWVPSGLAYLSVVNFTGFVPFKTIGNSHAQANYQDWSDYSASPINNGTAHVVAGPALDQMQPLSGTATVTNGYFNGTSRTVPTVENGQNAYYRVDITYPSSSGVYTQQSTVLNIPTGGGVSSITNLYFPIWIEWPDPIYYQVSPQNQVRVPGETFSITNEFLQYSDLGVPTYQWRKDGKEFGPIKSIDVYATFTNIILTVTNFQPGDAGVYDVKVLGNNWFISPKTFVSVQVSNGPGRFQNPRRSGSYFVADLLGVAGRLYRIQSSSNLQAWSDFATVTNTSGTSIFSTPASGSVAYFRAVLLP